MVEIALPSLIELIQLFFDRCMYFNNQILFYYVLNQLHAVSRTLQGRQREPSVKTLRSPLSAEFWRHCVLSGRTQRRACPRHQSEEMEI